MRDAIREIDALLRTADRQGIDGFLKRLSGLFDDMDAAYETAAKSSGFECRGCVDNCCMTRFFHHTVVEYLYIWKGILAIPAGGQNRLRQKAASAANEMRAPANDNAPIRVPCPLHENGRCLLYAHRPMICRLHGVAHRFQTPAGNIIAAPGCDAFTRLTEGKSHEPLDRTPFYRRMSSLEREFRTVFHFKMKIKMTIADILCAPPPALPAVEGQKVRRAEEQKRR